MGNPHEPGFSDIPLPLIMGWIDPERRWLLGVPIPVPAAGLCGWDGTGAGRGGCSLPAALAVGQGRAGPHPTHLPPPGPRRRLQSLHLNQLVLPALST